MMNLPLIKSILASAAVALATTQAVGADSLQDWASAVHKELSTNVAIPARVIDSRIQGVVKVRIDVAEDGSVVDYGLYETSGEDVLDRIALKSVASVASLPELPEGLTQQALVVPFRFTPNAVATKKATAKTAVTAQVEGWRRAAANMLASKDFVGAFAEAGVAGVVKVKFDVAHDGTIDAAVEQSSGVATLDAAAVRFFVEEAPAVPASMKNASFVVPVNFQLSGAATGR